MTVLILGAKGQLGQELLKTVPQGIEAIGLGHEKFDIEWFSYSRFRKINPDAVINCASFTNVNKAEETPVIAFMVNSLGVRNLARACVESQISLIHISTDFVFGGESDYTDLKEEYPPHPVNAYGRSKLLGEQAVQSVMAGLPYLILRTSWLHSAHGNNFVTKIIKAARTAEEIKMIVGERGVPTYTGHLAPAIWGALAELDKDPTLSGLYHIANRGYTNRIDFTNSILGFALEKGLIGRNPKIKSISNYDEVSRPSNSVLNLEKTREMLGIVLPYWTQGLEDCITEIARREEKK